MSIGFLLQICAYSVTLYLYATKRGITMATNTLLPEYVTLTIDDQPVRCEILVVFETDSKEYIALLPLNAQEEPLYDDGEVWLYRFQRDVSGGDEHQLFNIEDDEEYELAADKFDEWLDTQEFEETIS